MTTDSPTQTADDSVDVAEIMRQVRQRIAERQDHSFDRDLPLAMEAANQQWDKVYEPLRLPAGTSLPSRAWEALRTRLHQEVRSYLDPMIFRQTEFNSSVVRALNVMFRQSELRASRAEIEALRDEVLRLRAQVQRFEERLGERG